ncbi:hypothetical protein FHS29_003545 [Saccharothrix tamanrassetensis]|uniref:Uncharacterized protein n=1 Tax=Saccharothrix tamanrassetensis TaxID=1051531 RepID=A0A841CEH4_9PSEU|nr:hypothetical protein [Saccharothrix tamanrassetensis]MBB5956952.1 hypothetical protein [Saccharothrix tamanrassetensis]
MTTTTRSSPGLLRSLPLLVPGLLLLVAIALIPVSAGGDSLYRVTTPQFTVMKPDCAEDGTVVTCAMPVGDKTLTVVIDVDRAQLNSGCTATYGSRPTACTRDRTLGNVFTPAVVLDGFTVSDEAAEAVRAGQPWWSGIGESGLTRGLFGVLVGMSLAAALVSWLLSKRPRAADPNGARTTVTTAAAVLVPFAGIVLLVPPDQVADKLPMLLLPCFALTLVLPWQLLVHRAISGKIGSRLGLTAAALVATAVYGSATLLVLSLATGLVD